MGTPNIFIGRGGRHLFIYTRRMRRTNERRREIGRFLDKVYARTHTDTHRHTQTHTYTHRHILTHTHILS